MRSYQEIAEIMGTNKMEVCRAVQMVDKEIKRGNVEYVIPVVGILLRELGPKKFKRLMGKTGLKNLETFLNELEKVLRIDVTNVTHDVTHDEPKVLRTTTTNNIYKSYMER
jgi:hypothetical protein